MSRVSISFSCIVSEIQNTSHSRCIMSQLSIGFSCTILEIQNIGHSQCISPWEVIRAWFHEKM
ncbi:hypothetical protein GW17_00041899 [Ensete ventricosum]|nr:hypothetical protein GW17_00041899 [Ensete ventricosum]